MAAGLHKDVKGPSPSHSPFRFPAHSPLFSGCITATYFRIGHMGITVTDPSRGDIDRILEVIKDGLKEAGYEAPAKKDSH